MPRNVRNFWIELMVDGKATKVATGPRRTDGGFQVSIKQRSEGGIVEAVTIQGAVYPAGILRLFVTPNVEILNKEGSTGGTLELKTKR